MSDFTLVMVGASWGGLEATRRLLADLRGDLAMTVVIVQHRAADSPDEAMARFLRQYSSLPVSEVQDKDELSPGRVYLAPPDYHLLIEGDHFALSLEAPVQYSRPSIDVSFETAAEAYGAAVVGVVLTGANEDGAAGVLAIKAAGGRVLVQDPATAERPEMPVAAIQSGAADEVLTIEEIASELNRLGAPR